MIKPPSRKIQYGIILKEAEKKKFKAAKVSKTPIEAT